MPTIAIVDSGIDKNRADFDMGARVTDDVVITQLKPNSQGDGRGHGTFVAVSLRAVPSIRPARLRRPTSSRWT